MDSLQHSIYKLWTVFACLEHSRELNQRAGSQSPPLRIPGNESIPTCTTPSHRLSSTRNNRKFQTFSINREITKLAKTSLGPKIRAFYRWIMNETLTDLQRLLPETIGMFNALILRRFHEQKVQRAREFGSSSNECFATSIPVIIRPTIYC